MPLIRRALGLGLILAAIHAARPSGVAAQTGEQHWQLALANYTLSALAQFTGKVIRGENVGRAARRAPVEALRSEEHTSELQSQSNLVCRLLLEKKKKIQ